MADLAAIQRTLTEQGPLTGADLHAAIGGEVFGLWKTCRSSGQLVLRTIGRRYLRLDRTVEGFARLSPSILREFMTYTVVGAPAQAAAIEQAAEQLRSRTLAISRAKLRVAERFVAEVFESVVPEGGDGHHLCALIAGDVVYEMSHDVSRRESSTGGRVDGSDLDLIILASDDAPDELIEAVDAAIRQRKWLYLRNPALREEVDYIVKRFSRLVEQTEFATFQDMVACKVFDEAQFLQGNRELHQAGRRVLAERGVLDRLGELAVQAGERRAEREEYLLGVAGDVLPPGSAQQFFSPDEAAEFEHLG